MHDECTTSDLSDLIRNHQERFTCFGILNIIELLIQLGNTYGKIGHSHAEIVDVTPGSVVVEFLVHPSMRGGDRRTATNL